MLQPIDTDRLSHWPEIFAPLKAIPVSNEDSKQWFIPVNWGTTSVAYRLDLVEVTDNSYGLLWDKRYAGKLSIGEDATEIVMMAALVAGIADPFNPTDADLDRVREALEEQKPLLKFYWSDDTIIKEANPPEMSGTATGVVNFLNFTFSALLGPVFGWILMTVSGGASTMTLAQYQTAFEPLLYGVTLAIVLTLVLKETGPAVRLAAGGSGRR